MRVHGLLLLDKPRGLSSNAALQRARRLLQADKAGHGGTLDPLATGLLPLLVGEACKLARTQLDGDKRYEALVRFGTAMTTDDAEGEPVETAAVSLRLDDIEAALEHLRGPITQVPPAFSAIKVQGRALYHAARAGEAVEVPPRRVHVHELRVLDWASPDLRLDIRCSKGTYVRSIARDLGRALGCPAHLAGLRRTATAGWSVDEAVTLETLEAGTLEQRHARLVPLEALAAGRPALNVDAAQAQRFAHGQPVHGRWTDGAAGPAADDDIAVLHDGRLVGIGRLGPQDCVLPVRVIVP